MSIKTFNPEIYNLVVANGTIDNNFANISFTTEEFERFMAEFVKYVQKRQNDIVKASERGNTYMGEDVPSFLLINSLNECIWSKK